MSPRPALDPAIFAALTGHKACVDVGGTKVAVCIASRNGLLGRVTEPTAKQGASDALGRQVLRMIEQSCALADCALSDIDAVGVASCGPFIHADGCVELIAPNICGGLSGPAGGLPNRWMSVALEAPLRSAFTQVRVANDCVAALQAERQWGALKSIQNCAYVTWSTGIGMGLCVDGRVLHGKNGNAGHAGHAFVSDNDEARCGCGNIGDVESLIGGSAITRRFASVGYADAAALFEAARTGDAAALVHAEDLCRVMGRALYNLVVTLDLQRISLGGSLFWHQSDFLLPRLNACLAGGMQALTRGFELCPAGLGPHVSDLAALALVT